VAFPLTFQNEQKQNFQRIIREMFGEYEFFIWQLGNPLNYVALCNLKLKPLKSCFLMSQFEVLIYSLVTFLLEIFNLNFDCCF
jgi:hypothetical protein